MEWKYGSLFFNLGDRGELSGYRHLPAALPRERDTVHNLQGLGGLQGRYKRVWKMSLSQDRPDRTESLYRLAIPASPLQQC
jgi:hypothetical protein